MSENSSIDKLAEQYTGTESEAEAYQKAQSATIISQTKEINQLRKDKEKLEKELEKLTIENVQFKALNPSQQSQFEITDQETICVVQIALLKNLAMQRELSLEECRKTEIYVKVLKEIHARKPNGDETNMNKLSNAELIALMDEVGSA